MSVCAGTAHEAGGLRAAFCLVSASSDVRLSSLRFHSPSRLFTGVGLEERMLPAERPVGALLGLFFPLAAEGTGGDRHIKLAETSARPAMRCFMDTSASLPVVQTDR